MTLEVETGQRSSILPEILVMSNITDILGYVDDRYRE